MVTGSRVVDKDNSKETQTSTPQLLNKKAGSQTTSPPALVIVHRLVRPHENELSNNELSTSEKRLLSGCTFRAEPAKLLVRTRRARMRGSSWMM